MSSSFLRALPLLMFGVPWIVGCDGGTNSTGGQGGDGASTATGGGGSGAGETGGGGAGAEGGGGAAPAVCGGIAGQACDEGFYCDFTDDAMCGAGDQQGTCVAVPQGCVENCPGVCGCDGQFYCNDCIAAQAGIDVDPNGNCKPPGVVCGGLGNPECGPTEFCDYPDDQMCGAFDGTGICTPRPENCTDDCPGVCGCNGDFYCNGCMAQAAGVDVSPTKNCTFPGEFCGGIAGVACPDGKYCDYPDATMCGAGDQGGTCQPIPDICPQDCPGVCGCDGKPYCNACIASQAGVDVAVGVTCN